MKLFVFSLFYICKKNLIRFNHDKFLSLPEENLALWLNSIVEQEGYIVEELEYNFVDTDTMLSLNQEYLNHDTDTDIITFDYTESKAIKAEAYISCDALKKTLNYTRKLLKMKALGYFLTPYFTVWAIMTRQMSKKN
jgi:ssRNA-specific RNase YbeY (16S rRNA maturation enzyme)